jgi:hypothetical protein
MGHAHLLPRRAQIQAALKIQPMRAGVQRPVRPAMTPIKFRDQPQPAIVGGIQVAGELGDLRFEFRQGKIVYLVMDAVHEGSR